MAKKQKTKSSFDMGQKFETALQTKKKDNSKALEVGKKLVFDRVGEKLNLFVPQNKNSFIESDKKTKQIEDAFVNYYEKKSGKTVSDIVSDIKNKVSNTTTPKKEINNSKEKTSYVYSSKKHNKPFDYLKNATINYGTVSEEEANNAIENMVKKTSGPRKYDVEDAVEIDKNIKTYKKYLNNEKNKNPYFGMSYSDLITAQTELNEKLEHGQISYEDFSRQNYEINLQKIKTASSEELVKMRTQVVALRDQYKDLTNKAELYNDLVEEGASQEATDYYKPTEFYKKNAKTINENYEYYNSLLSVIDEINEINIREKTAKEITDKYKVLSDKMNVSSEYVPNQNYNGKIFFPEKANEDELYDIINLYHNGTIKNDNIVFASSIIDGSLAYKPTVAKWMLLTDSELKEFNRAYKRGMGTAYLNELDPVLEMRLSYAQTQINEEYGKQHPVLGAIEGISGRVLGGIPATVDNLIIDPLTSGSPNTYDASSRNVRNANAKIAGGSQYINNKYGSGAAFAYNTAISITENVANFFLAKGVGKIAGLGNKGISNVASVNMFGMAASDTMLDIADRGGTPAQIILGGVASGSAELFFENWSIGKILNNGDAKRFVRTILKDAGVNAQEEFVTSLSNIWIDAIVMGDKNASQLRKNELIKQGYSPQEAGKIVYKENLHQTILDATAGAISGGIMSSGQNLPEYINYKSNMNNVVTGVVNSGNLDSIIKLGSEFENSEAINLKNLVEKGITPTRSQIKNTIASVIIQNMEKDASLPNVVKTIATIEGQDSSYYTSKKAIDTANAVYRMANDIATQNDYNLIERSEGARTVILSAEGTKAWDSLKAEADKRVRNAEYGMRSETPHPSPAVTPFLQGKDSGVKYRIAHTTENKPVVVIENDILDGVDKKDWVRTAKDAIKKFRPEIPISGRFIKVNKVTSDEYTNSNYTKGLKRTDAVKYRDKLTAAGNLDEIVIASTQYVNEGLNHTRKDNIKDFARGNVLLEVGGRQYSADVIIGTKSNGEMLLYDIVNMDAENFDIKKKMNPKTVSSENRTTIRQDSPSIDSISKNKATVNSKDMQNVEKDAHSEKKVPSPEEAKKAENVDNGIVVTEESKQLKKENLKAYNNIGKLATSLKTRAVVVRGLKNSKGEVLAGKLSGGVIYVNADVGADKISRWAALHEASHLIKQKAAKIWQRFENYAIKRLKDTEEYKNKYSLKEGDYETNEINEELACDYIGDLFESEAELTEFIKTDKNFAVKIRDGFFNALSRWGLFGERKKAQALWLKAYQAAMKNDVKSQINKKSVAGTRVEESSVSEASESLKEENARLRKLIENMHIQLDQAEGKGLDLKAVKNEAINLRKKYSSKIKVYEFHQELSKIYQLMSSDLANSNEVSDRINALAQKVIDNATETVSSEYWNVIKALRETKIKVPEADKANFSEGYENFRKANMGKLILSKEGYPLDALWDDLVKDYYELFSEEAIGKDLKGSEERLNRILEVMDEFKPVEQDVYKTESEKQKAVTELANDIMETFYEIPEGGETHYVFYDKKGVQAEKEAEKAKEEADKKVARAEEKNEKLRDRYDREKVKKGINRYFNYLFKMYSEPTDARHIPEQLRRDVGNILERINFETKHTDKLKAKGEENVLSIRLEGIADVFKKIQNEAWGVLSEEDSPTIDAALKQDLEDLVKEIPVDNSGNQKRIEDMTTEELKAVYEMLMSVHHAVTKSNEAFSDYVKGKVNENADVVDKDMETTRSKRRGSGEKLDYNGGKIKNAFTWIDKIVNGDLLEAWDFFHKLGGKMEELYNAARKSYDDYIRNLQKFKKVLNEATKDVKIKKIDDVETIELLGGIKIKLTRGQMISLTALYRRPQGRQHILNGGIVTKREWIDENGHKRNGNIPIKINDYDMGNIMEQLTSKETEMMVQLVNFMSKECAKWGNETSMKLLGYEKYGEGWYFPIKVYDGSLEKTSAKKGEKKLTNKSFTESLDKNASNAIEVNDFLDVVLEHVNSMSMYSTVALPLLDMERVLNHKGKGTTSKDAREAIRITYGEAAEQYIYDWIRKVNGNVQKVKADVLDKLIANTKKAHIAFKLSVFLKQMTSIARAMQVMNPKYLRASLNSLIHPKKTIQEMQENVPIAFWKSLGFRDPAMGTGIKNAMLGTESVTDKLGFGLYGKADDFTWGVIYNAVKDEVRTKMTAEIKSKMEDSTKAEIDAEIKKLTIENEEFLKRVIDRFNYVIDRTQVVDSPFHNSQIMRSNNPMTRVVTSYMSESIKTLNLYRTDLQDALNEAIEKGTSIPLMKKLSRSTATFILQAILLSVAGAIPQILKDEPEDKYDKDGKKISAWNRFQKHMAENFDNEINPLRMVPYVNKIFDVIEGWEQKEFGFEGIDDLARAIKNFVKDEGKKKSTYIKFRELVSSVAALTGMPYGNAVKEVEGIARTAMSIAGEEYADYIITKGKWDVRNPENKSKFMKHYENAIINGHPEEANDILEDYLSSVYAGTDFKNEHSEAVLAETAKLYGTTDSNSSLLFDLPEDKFKFDNKEIQIPEDQYDEFVDGYYDTLWDAAYEFVTSEEYSTLSNEDKVRSFGELKEYAKNVQKTEYADGYELTGWNKNLYEGKIEFVDSVLERKANREYEDSKEQWIRDNFNYNESDYTESELTIMEQVESDASSYYVSIEQGKELPDDLRHMQVYDDYLEDSVPVVEYAGVRAYAKKTAALESGSPNALSKDELKSYLDSTDYSKEVKAALFEAIANKGWINPYTGQKVGNGRSFPDID